MRKKKLTNRLKRLEDYKLKRPIAVLKRKINGFESSLRTFTIIIIILTGLFLFIFLTGIFETNYSSWKTEEITYTHLIYETYHSAKGGTTHLYIIYDSNGKYYRISWYEELENSGFKNEVKVGEKLIIQHHNWFYSDLVETLKTNDKIYRSESDAKDFCKSLQKELLIISFIVLFLIFIVSIFFIKLIIKYKIAKKELIIENEKYNNQQDKLSN